VVNEAQATSENEGSVQTQGPTQLGRVTDATSKGLQSDVRSRRNLGINQGTIGNGTAPLLEDETAGCPIMWKSQLQTEIALSSCESEYIAFSQALRKVIPAMHLIQDMKRHNCHNTPSVPNVHCTLFEDNSGALPLAKAPAMRPRTKHINIKYNHFRSHVADETIDIQAIRSKDQPADILTKPLTESVFVLHRHAIMGWGQVPTGEEHIAKSFLPPP
jgi:hypothetical protein